MKISVIICHHKGRLIDMALDSLMKSAEVDYELIVATSDVVENIKALQTKYPTVRFIEIAGGPAHKRNVACKFAGGEFIAFYDDDISATPYSLFQMQSFLKEHDKCGMVFGKLLNMEWPDRFDEAGSFLTSTGFLWARAESGVLDHGQYEDACPILAGKSAACMIRRKLFWQVQAFDSSYEILGEETDLAWRVWLAGYSVFFVPKSVTYHAFNTKFKPSDFYTPGRVYFNGSRNYLSMLATNLETFNLIFPITTQIIVWTFAAMGMLITGKFEAGSYIFKGLFYFFKRIPQILVKRLHVQSTRKISDKELLHIIVHNPPISYYIKRFFHYIKTGRHG